MPQVNTLCRDNLVKIEGSPNRGGICYRVCRKKWQVESADNKNERGSDLPNECRLLTTELFRYAKAGVTCFKIQGREYSLPLVTNMVRAYRVYLNALETGRISMDKRLNDEFHAIELARDEERTKRTNSLVNLAAQSLEV